MAKIRIATAADIPRLVSLGQRMHGESPRFGGTPFKTTRAVSATYDLIHSDMGCVFVAEEDDQIIGMFFGAAFQHIFTYEYSATEILLYVVPEHRGGSAAARLVKAYEGWAKGKGITDLSLGVSTEIHPEKTVNFYLKLGYTLSGYITRREL